MWMILQLVPFSACVYMYFHVHVGVHVDKQLTDLALCRYVWLIACEFACVVGCVARGVDTLERGHHQAVSVSLPWSAARQSQAHSRVSTAHALYTHFGAKVHVCCVFVDRDYTCVHCD